MLLLLYSDQEVVGLNVSVQETVLVYELYSLQHLYGEHQHSFECEFPTAVLEEILEARPEQVDRHHVVVALLAKEMNFWQANCTKQKFKIPITPNLPAPLNILYSFAS